MLNINDIPKDIDVTTVVVADIDGVSVSLNGVGERMFDLESDADWFIDGLQYAAQRLNSEVLTSNVFFRQTSPSFGFWIVRIVIGEGNLWSTEDGD